MAFDPKIPYNDLPDLPPDLNAETREIIGLTRKFSQNPY